MGTGLGSLGGVPEDLLAKAVNDFNTQLSSAKAGALTQVGVEARREWRG